MFKSFYLAFLIFFILNGVVYGQLIQLTGMPAKLDSARMLSDDLQSTIISKIGKKYSPLESTVFGRVLFDQWNDGKKEKLYFDLSFNNDYSRLYISPENIFRSKSTNARVIIFKYRNVIKFTYQDNVLNYHGSLKRDYLSGTLDIKLKNFEWADADKILILKCLLNEEFDEIEYRYSERDIFSITIPQKAREIIGANFRSAYREAKVQAILRDF